MYDWVLAFAGAAAVTTVVVLAVNFVFNVLFGVLGA